MEDRSYLSSTQYRLFTFTPSKLASLRLHTNHLAASSILSSASSPTPDWLTASEELKLISHYAINLSKICTHYSTPSAVRATALTFLHRLYLHVSPLTVHPKTLLLPLLLLAFKCETGNPSVKRFIATAESLGLKTSWEELLEPETMIAMNLRWSFTVRHPWRGLEGLKQEMLAMEVGEARRVEKACVKARTILTGQALFTDAQFLFTPPQVMLAAVWTVDADLVKAWVLKRRIGDRLLRVVEGCARRYLLGEGEDKDDQAGLLRRGGDGEVITNEMKSEAIRVDKKLYHMKNRVRAKESKREQEEKEREKEEERLRKKRKLEQEKMEMDDVFGPPLKRDG